MLYSILITITLFFVGLGLRVFLKNLCALCFAIAGTWIILIGENLFFGIITDTLVLGIYMGASATGFLYFLSTKLKEKYYIFKLPFLLTLFSMIYFFIFGLDKNIVFTLFLLWLLFLSVFIFRNYPKLKHLASKIIECCRNW